MIKNKEIIQLNGSTLEKIMAEKSLRTTIEKMMIDIDKFIPTFHGPVLLLLEDGTITGGYYDGIFSPHGVEPTYDMSGLSFESKPIKWIAI